MKLAPALMVQGTASSVGKSLVVTALCRRFRQDGLHVVPFKAQNMALNAFVTPTGGEIGRAQAAQAEAAGVVPSVDMNPILLKPEGDRMSQVVVLGKPRGRMSAADYHREKPELRAVVAESLKRLRQSSDLVVIEGAGSPAEINLKAHDIVNMSVAHAADARVLLVGDIDRGGVFAAFVGTLALLDPEERARIGAFVINKFRGDPSLLTSGLDFLHERTGVPVLGVLPHLPGLALADEDSLNLDERSRHTRQAQNDEIDIAVVRLPRLSNFDDFAPLDHQPGIVLRFASHPAELARADLVILPGSKSTVADLAWLRESGLAAAITERARRGLPLLGICGGCQMLGTEIRDPNGVETRTAAAPGLGLLPFFTQFETTKMTAQVRAQPATVSFLTDTRDRGAGDGVSREDSSEPSSDPWIEAYEIHMGRLHALPGAPRPAFGVRTRNGHPVTTTADARDGAVSADGATVGTLLHGLFENSAITRGLINHLRSRRGLPALATLAPWSREATYDRLAAHVREHFDEALLQRLIGRSISQA
jgi:adenosylcobyric acid synthase